MGVYRRRNKDGSVCPVWWMAFSAKGKQKQRSTGTADKRSAERIYAKVVTTVNEGRFLDKEVETHITFGELVTKYMEKYKRQRDPYTIKKLLPVFGGMPATEIDIDHVEDYIDTRLAEGVSEGTVYQEFALARRIYNVTRRRWRKELGIKENPFADAGFPGYDNCRFRYATLEEENKLIAKARTQDMKDIILFALHTGCRRGEILACKWKENIDMQKRVITMRVSKQKPGENPRYKFLKMTSKLYEMLLRRKKAESITGNVFDLTGHSVRYEFDIARAEAKVTDMHFHDLRHTFASRLVQSGVSIYVVSRLLGHKTISTTERYSHLSPESLEPAAKALDGVYDVFMTLKETAIEHELAEVVNN